MRLLVLGIDAAGWELVEALIAQGVMPTLAALIEDGWRARLTSTAPPITPPAWTTLITGMHPSHHGVISFCQPDRGAGLVKPTCGGERLVRTMFEHLADDGASCGAVDIPWTYPAEAPNGFCVSGFDAPGLEGRAFSPAEAAPVLRSAAPGYALTVSAAGPLEPVLEQIEERTRAIEALVQWRPVDVLYAVITATDGVGHLYWPAQLDDLSPSHPLVRTYGAADQALGKLVESLAPDTVVVLSDHGMGPCHAVVNLSRPLFDAGLQVPAATGSQRAVLPLYRTARWFYRRWRRTLPAAEAGPAPSPNRWAPRVNWDASTAHSGSGFGWVVLGDEATAGDETRVLEAVMGASAALESPAIIGMQRSAESSSVPRLRFDVDLDCGYWLCPPILDPVEPFLIRDPVHPVFQRAGHRREGIFVASGRGAARGVGERAIPAVDVAPTLMYLAGGNIPDGLDGNVHLAALDPYSFASRPPTWQPVVLARSGAATCHDDEDQAAVEQRLRELGYLD